MCRYEVSPMSRVAHLLFQQFLCTRTTIRIDKMLNPGRRMGPAQLAQFAAPLVLPDIARDHYGLPTIRS